MDFFIMWLERFGYGCAELYHRFFCDHPAKSKLEQIDIGFLSVLFVLNLNDSFVCM